MWISQHGGEEREIILFLRGLGCGFCVPVFLGVIFLRVNGIWEDEDGLRERLEISICSNHSPDVHIG